MRGFLHFSPFIGGVKPPFLFAENRTYIPYSWSHENDKIIYFRKRLNIWKKRLLISPTCDIIRASKAKAEKKEKKMKTRYYENGDKTTVVNYRFVGYGLDSEAVYQRIITVYSIAEGVLIANEPQPVKVWYR